MGFRPAVNPCGTNVCGVSVAMCFSLP